MHRSRFVVSILFLLLLFATVAEVAAQTAPRTPRSPATVLGGGGTTRRAGSSTFGAELPPIDRAVDPELYMLGPNDQLVVTIPALEEMSLGGEFPIVISADHVVGLPRGVTINARGMTLAQFRRAVTAAFERRGGALDVSSVVLARPRSIYVTVRGDVQNPGRFIMTAADRASTAIDIANELEAGTPEADLQRMVREQGGESFEATGSRKGANLSLDQMPRRNVTIRHNDGSSTSVDLARYAAFGDDRANPTLREGDEIFVSGPDNTGPTIAIAGAVNSPTVLEYRRGDNALMLVRLAAGVTAAADAGAAYIARRSETGQSRIPINLADTVALASIALEPGDRIFVPLSETRPESRTGFVIVEGAVGQPSAYPIINGETKLSEVVELAGGFAADASINGAHIVRTSDPGELEMGAKIDDRVALISTSDLTLEDTTRFKFDQKVQRDRVSADFVRLFLRGDRSADVSLRNGDRIVVPTNPRSVYVYGRVMHPGAVDFVEGATAEYYIARAGGYMETADPSRVQVIKFGSGLPVGVDDSPVQSGDQIYVAGERDLPARTPLEETATALSILASLTAATWAIINIINFFFPQGQ